MTKLLITAVALASIFAGQQAVAKSSTKTVAASKKHKKHHKTKTVAAIGAPALTVGVMS